MAYSAPSRGWRGNGEQARLSQRGGRLQRAASQAAGIPVASPVAAPRRKPRRVMPWEWSEEAMIPSRWGLEGGRPGRCRGGQEEHEPEARLADDKVGVGQNPV